MDPNTRARMQQLVEERENSKLETINGLGDVIAKVTKKVGIQPCEPCEQRRQRLNKWFPIK